MFEQPTLQQQVELLRKDWETNPRWAGIKRTYTAEEVVQLRSSLMIDHTLARVGAERLWHLLTSEDYVNTFGAMTGMQATQMVRAGMKSIYVSGWQTASDSNLAGQTYPDQSLYPSNSVPAVIKRINNALMRADQVERLDGNNDTYWFAPIVADAEAGFGGPLHAFELTKSMIEAGVAGVHFEDQLAAEKKCGHLGGKVLVPTSQFIRTMTGARLAADVMGVPTLLIARTDAESATLLTSDIDPYDQEFCTGGRTLEGYFNVRGGMDACVKRGLAYANYADLLWMETKTPNLEEARQFAEAIHAEFPGKMLAYNCSPSFNWQQHLDKDTIAKFQRELGAMGYKFQFITLAGWHTLNYSTFDLARKYVETGMPAYVEVQQQEFEAAEEGYTAVRHQRESGTSYFDQLLYTVTGGGASTGAMEGSTESHQFV
jgi:isocitrate lyase